MLELELKNAARHARERLGVVGLALVDVNGGYYQQMACTSLFLKELLSLGKPGYVEGDCDSKIRLYKTQLGVLCLHYAVRGADIAQRGSPLLPPAVTTTVHVCSTQVAILHPCMLRRVLIMDGLMDSCSSCCSVSC